MDKDILVKRGPGRPVGSKDTKPRKPSVRTAFAYSQKQSDYVKYIIRKDKKGIRNGTISSGGSDFFHTWSAW